MVIRNEVEPFFCMQFVETKNYEENGSDFIHPSW